MRHLVLLPFVLPAFAACVLLMLASRPRLQRAVSMLAAVAIAAVVLVLALRARGGVVETYAMGDWPAWIGIVFVADRLSTFMLCLTAAVAVPALLYASHRWDRQGPHFHPLFHLLWAGLDGAFLTGDLFNLFVCFELMLIASYALLQHGGGTARLAAGVHYVVLNLLGSALFLVAVGLLYRAGGTLNLADMAVAAAAADPADAPWWRAGCGLLLVVFLLKGAIAPLCLWLPATYAAAAAPVAAMLAVLTKVGAYAVLRVGGTFAFAAFATPWLHPAVLAAALVTLVVAALGAVAARTLSTLAAWLGLASSALMLTAFAVPEVAAAGGGLFYALPGTLGLAALLLLADAIRAARGASGDALERAPRMGGATALGALYVVSAVTLAGLPPLAGFLGKALILAGSADHPWVWGVVLACSLLQLVALVRAGTRLFWSVEPRPAAHVRPGLAPVAAIALLLASVVGVTVGAGPLSRFTAGAAAAAREPSAHLEAVLGAQRLRWTVRVPVEEGASR